MDTATIRRFGRLPAVFAFILAFVAGFVVIGASPAAASPISGKRAAILMPFSGGGTTWVSGDGPDVHHTFYYGWAEDLHAVDGTAVQARFQTSDGNLTLSVVDVQTLNCTVSTTNLTPVNGGKVVFVKVLVDGTEVGRVLYEHLNNVQVSAGQAISAGTTLGYTKWWSNSTCWQVSTASGVHTHLEAQRGCYRNLNTNTFYSGSTAVGMLSSNYGTTNKSLCDEGEVTSVMAPANTTPAAHFTVPVNNQDLMVLVDGTSSTDSDGTITSYQWAFGDGATASGSKSSHQYSAAGNYVITLTVTDNAGAQNSTTQSVNIRTGQLSGDVNGDGKEDAITFFGNTGSWYVSLSNGSSFVRNTNTWLWASGFGTGSSRQMLADVTGDGKSDAVVFFGNTGSWYVAPSNGSSFVQNSSAWLWTTDFGTGSPRQLLSDITGDGKADAVVFFGNTGSWYVAPSTGSSFDRSPSTWLWSSSFGIGSDQQLLVDITGDGKSDAVVFFTNTGSWYVAPSSGTGFIQAPSTWLWATNFGIGTDRQLLADITGDGKADAVVFFGNTGSWYVAPSNGSSFVQNSSTWLWSSGFGTGSDRQMLTDGTGDGKADAVSFFTNTGSWYMVPSDGSSFVQNPSNWQWITDFGTGS